MWYYSRLMMTKETGKDSAKGSDTKVLAGAQARSIMAYWEDPHKWGGWVQLVPSTALCPPLNEMHMPWLVKTPMKHGSIPALKSPATLVWGLRGVTNNASTHALESCWQALGERFSSWWWWESIREWRHQFSFILKSWLFFWLLLE